MCIAICIKNFDQRTRRLGLLPDLLCYQAQQLERQFPRQLENAIKTASEIKYADLPSLHP